MSSRALRKLQRQQEEQNRLAELQKAGSGEDEDEEESEQDEIKPAPTAQKSAFELLSGDLDEEDDQDIDDEANEENEDEPRQSTTQVTADSSPARAAAGSSKGKKKKKGKKAKKKAKGAGRDESTGRPPDGDAEPDLDDIDRALKELRTKDEGKVTEPAGQVISAEWQAFYRLLGVDSKNLKVLNEMKRLFGSSVLESESEGGAARRRGRGPQQLDLGAAFDRRNNPLARGQGLSERVLRKNIFIQGKEGWLNETGGGLGMEIEAKEEDQTTEYRYVHSMAYRTSQREFLLCVETMDPQRVIHFLQFNPYHISGLLQVSEIAKQHQEPAVAVDLLERALFSFGRAAHSTFNAAMTEGTARLDFRRPENRELWLAGYRYVKSLGQRGTWRTAYEWAKFLFSLDPEGDPYQMRLVIDQLAVRAGQFEQLIQLAAVDTSTLDWGQKLPNICISVALAHSRLGHGAECRKALASAVQQFPWIIERLLKELDIDRIPKSVWGKTARTAREKLHAEAYVLRAKDMWNTPEAVGLLVEVAETTDALEKLPPPDETAIDLNEARHIILDETPALIGLLPRIFTEARTSASDPLPPDDDEPSYDPVNPHESNVGGEPDSLSDESESGGGDGADEAPPSANAVWRGWANRVMARFGGAWPGGAAGGDDGNDGHDDEEGGAAEPAGPEGGRRGLRERNARERMAAEEQLLAEQEDAMLAEVLRQSQAEWEATQGRAEQAEAEAPTSAPVSASVPVLRPTVARSGAPSPSPERTTPASTGTAPAPAPAPASASTSAPPDQDTAAEPTDPQATQRFLAGRGLVALKEFVAAHGADESKWPFDIASSSSAVDAGADASADAGRPVTQYIRRARMLNAQQRRFILDFVVPQSAGAEVGELVRRLVGGGGAGATGGR